MSLLKKQNQWERDYSCKSRKLVWAKEDGNEAHLLNESTKVRNGQRIFCSTYV